MTANPKLPSIKRCFILTVLLCLLPGFCIADTFTVTTKSDNGTGSLRKAIASPAANGIATKDTIIFSIPDTTRAGRTIELQSPLPDLTSNLVVDGSTQAGSSFGKSRAKVILLNKRSVISIKNFSLHRCR
jgi:hypothetical protein